MLSYPSTRHIFLIPFANLLPTTSFCAFESLNRVTMLFTCADGARNVDCGMFEPDSLVYSGMHEQSFLE